MHSPSSASPRDNAILAALSKSELEFLRPHLDWVELERGQVLHEEGASPRPTYFLTQGVVALTISSEEGKPLQLSLIGPEGIVGERAIFEGGMPLVRCELLTQGAAYRMRPEFFNEEFHGGGRLHDLTMRSLEARIVETSQTALCSERHSIEHRLVRWLLTFSDRLGSGELPVTQETIADMLGTGRPGISEALGILAKAGLIEQSRGLIGIVNRKGLKKRSCECYHIIKAAVERAYHAKRDIEQSGEE